MSESHFKLGRLVGDECVEHSHDRLYYREKYSDELTFIVAGLPSGDVTVVRNLARSLSEDCFLLYVHHTPRTDHDEGRYQSPLLDMDEVEDFLERFGRLLAADARHNFWIHSPKLSATLVWDNHNILYCYGPVEHFETELARLGYEYGDPIIPIPHSHNYHADLDADVEKLMNSMDWQMSALTPQDGQ